MLEVVLHKSHKGFILPDEFCVKYNRDKYDDVDSDDPEFVKFLKEHDGQFDDWKLLKIPGDVTDWFVDEYDGWECIIYCINGHIYKR